MSIAPYDIDAAEGVEPENAPHPEFTDWQARPSAGAWLEVLGVVSAVLVVAAVFVVTVMVGWPK